MMNTSLVKMIYMTYIIFNIVSFSIMLIYFVVCILKIKKEGYSIGLVCEIKYGVGEITDDVWRFLT